MSQYGRYIAGSSNTPIDTLTGNSGGPVGPDGAGNIDVLGAGAITVSGNALTHTLTISFSGMAFVWNSVAGTTQAMAVNNGYITQNGALTTFTLPALAAVGDIVQVVGFGAGGWQIDQNIGQVIHFGIFDTTPGVGGSIASNVRYDGVQLICTAVNTDWVVVSSFGNITIV